MRSEISRGQRFFEHRPISKIRPAVETRAICNFYILDF